MDKYSDTGAADISQSSNESTVVHDQNALRMLVNDDQNARSKNTQSNYSSKSFNFNNLSPEVSKLW